VYLFDRLRPPRPLTYAWIVAVLVAAVLMYPLTPIFF
jgi:hypothetical protein